MAIEVQFVELGRKAGLFPRLEDRRRIDDRGNDRAAFMQRTAKSDQQMMLDRIEFQRFDVETASGFDFPDPGG